MKNISKRILVLFTREYDERYLVPLIICIFIAWITIFLITPPSLGIREPTFIKRISYIEKVLIHDVKEVSFIIKTSSSKAELSKSYSGEIELFYDVPSDKLMWAELWKNSFNNDVIKIHLHKHKTAKDVAGGGWTRKNRFFLGKTEKGQTKIIH